MSDYVLYRTNYPENISFHYAKSNTCEVVIHLHDSYEIFMALSDNIKYFIEGEVYDLAKGDIIITNASEVHRPQVTDHNPYERRFIQFKPEFFSHLLGSDFNPLRIFTHRSVGKGNKFALSTIDSPHVQSIFQCFDTIQSLYQKDDPRSQLLIYSIMIQLLIHLGDIYDDQQHPQTFRILDERVKKMLILIENNFQTKISLDTLSAALYVDKYYISHLFKEATGFTVMEYIQSKRIQLAKKQIIQGKPITEICYACGFEDYSNFYKTFKKLVHCSPKEYRDRI